MISTPTAWSVSVARSFIDTNILVDADDAFDPRKQQLALELVVDLRARQEAVLSTQVLQEYFVTATRKLGLEAHVARQRVTHSDASNGSSPRWTCCWLPWFCNRTTSSHSGMR